MINGYGGNTNRASGQLALTGSAQQIPVPAAITARAAFDANALQIGGAVLKITPSQHDVYMGEDNNVTSSTGHRLPANNTPWPITAVRGQQVWVTGTSGDSLTYQWEWNG